MKVSEVIPPDGIIIYPDIKSYDDAIKLLAGLHSKAGKLYDEEGFIKDIYEREAQGGAVVGDGIAIPHAKSLHVKEPSVTAINLRDGIRCGDDKKKSVRLVFMIAATNDAKLHMEILSKLTGVLVNRMVIKALMEAETPEEFVRIIKVNEKD